MNTVDQIAEEIKSTIKPLMEKWVADRVTYLHNLRTWTKSAETIATIEAKFAKNKPLAGKYYTRSDARATVYDDYGIGKGDEQLIAYYGADDWLIKTQKQAEDKMKKIDFAVKKKVDFVVNSVEKLFVEHGKDGYVEGAWKLNNEKVFSFETFYAGGYNIQCLHIRTKYKLK